jgi:hypothetical protein
MAPRHPETMKVVAVDLRDHLDVEVTGATTSGRSEPRHELLVGEKPVKSVCDRRGIRRRNDPSVDAMGDLLTRPEVAIGHDHRNTAGHRLGDDVAEALPGRGENESPRP